MEGPSGQLFPIDIEAAQMDEQACDDLVITATQGVGASAVPVVMILFNENCEQFIWNPVVPLNRLVLSDPQWTAVAGLTIKDLNADGVPDIAVACTHNQLPLPKPAVFVFYGPYGGWTPSSAPLLTQRVRSGVEFPMGSNAQGPATDVAAFVACETGTQLGGDLVVSMDVTSGASFSERFMQLLNSGMWGQDGIQWFVRNDAILNHSSLRIAKGDLDPGPNIQDWISYSRDRLTGDTKDLCTTHGLTPPTCVLFDRFAHSETTPAYSSAFGVDMRPLDFAYADDVALCYYTGGTRGGAIDVFLSNGGLIDPLDEPVFFFTVPAGRLAGPRVVRIADMNRDSRLDLVVSNALDGSIGVLINSTPLPQY